MTPTHRSHDMTDTMRDLTAEDREWIDARADQLFRDSERQRGSVRPAAVMPQDFRDYFVAQAAWERARAALAAAPQPATEYDWGKPVGKEVLPPYEPAPAPADERAEMIEVIRTAVDHWPDPGSPADIADDLRDAGYRRGGAEAGLREALSELDALRKVNSEAIRENARLIADRPSAPETLAWAVVDDEGEIVLSSIWAAKEHAEPFSERSGWPIHRVAIRGVEGGDDAA